MKTIEQLEAEITQLKHDLERLKNPSKPIIERTEDYTFIDAVFNVVSDINCGVEADDNRHAAYNYYPADGVLCRQVADYLKRTHLFTRKAIEFAGGYEPKKDKYNFFVRYSHADNTFGVFWEKRLKDPLKIYLSKANADRFMEWCNKHKKELGYD